MDTHIAIRTRRAIKHYDPTHHMTDQELQELLELACLSPTAFNIQNWRFVVIRDPELRQKIRAVSWNQAQVTDASVLIILCADLNAWEKEPKRYWEKAPQEVQSFMIPAIDNYYRGHARVQMDEAMRSCGMAAQTLMLAAMSMGYESCPMDGFDYDKVGELINLPTDHVISMFVVIGKGIKEAWPLPGQLSLQDVVIENSF